VRSRVARSCCDERRSLKWPADAWCLGVISFNNGVSFVDAPRGPDVQLADGLPALPDSPLAQSMQRSGTQVISRTLDVIECFFDVPERGVNEIARLCGLSPSTAHRVVRALVARGYLEQNASRNRYRLGPSAIQFGDAVQRHVSD
jgi:predicted transcriptional regulator